MCDLKQRLLFENTRLKHLSVPMLRLSKQDNSDLLPNLSAFPNNQPRNEMHPKQNLAQLPPKPLSWSRGVRALRTRPRTCAHGGD